MFAAPPIPPGRDLNEIERREHDSSYQSIFGPYTNESMTTAQAIQKHHTSSRIDIGALFEEIEKEQQEEPERSRAASSVPVESILPVTDDIEEEESIGEETASPKALKATGKPGKAPAKSKASAGVVKKTSNNKF